MSIKKSSFLSLIFVFAVIFACFNVKNPLVILLMSLAILSYLTGDIRATVVIFVMVVLDVVLRFYPGRTTNTTSSTVYLGRIIPVIPTIGLLTIGN